MIGKADLQQSISPQKNSKKAAPNWSWTISRTLPWLAEQSNRGVLLGIGEPAGQTVPRQYEPWEDHTRSGSFETVVSNILIIMQISSPLLDHFSLERLFKLGKGPTKFGTVWPEWGWGGQGGSFPLSSSQVLFSILVTFQFWMVLSQFLTVLP